MSEQSAPFSRGLNFNLVANFLLTIYLLFIFLYLSTCYLAFFGTFKLDPKKISVLKQFLKIPKI